MPKGIPKSGINKNWFKKGEHSSPATEFKKGCKPALYKGRIKDSYGAILIHSPNHPFCNNQNYVFEHRLVMEKHLGRYLTHKEVVHHINKIVDDNRIENLILFSSNSNHRRFHGNPQNVKPSEIIFDGRKFTYSNH